MTHPTAATANDRLKESFEGALALSLMLAAALHALAFALWPEMSATPWDFTPASQLDLVRVDEVTIPDEPAEVNVPAAPVVTADAAPDATLTPIDFGEYVELPLPPPQATSSGGTGETIPFTPYTTPPRLDNPAEVQRALARPYPPALRDAGLGGTVTLLVHVDADGALLEHRLTEGSGYDALDQAALGVANVLRFKPAMNRDKFVAVWIRLPLTFTVR